MARDYGILRPAFWTGSTGKRLRQQPAETALIAAYLFSNGHASAIGIYHLPLLYISHETGRAMDRVTAALAWLEHENFAFYDYEREEVFVPNMAREQIGTRLKPRDKRIPFVAAELAKVRGSKFIASFLELYGGAFLLEEIEGASKPLRSPFEGDTEPLRSQEQEQEQEQEQDQEQEQEQKAPEESDDSSGRSPGEKPPAKTKTPQQVFVDQVRELYGEFDATPPAPGLTNLWAKEIFRGHRDWMLRELRELARSGHLVKGHAYVRRALEGSVQRGAAPLAIVPSAPAPVLVRKVGERSHNGKFEWDGSDWAPVDTAADTASDSAAVAAGATGATKVPA